MKKMLIALLAAASLQATAQTEGNDTSFPNVVTDSVIPSHTDETGLIFSYIRLCAPKHHVQETC